MSDWTGHPWATADHEDLGDGSWCVGCYERCTQRVGCSCCNQPAYEWCLEEARWWAEEGRTVAAHVDPHDVGADCWAHRTLPTQHGIRLWLRPLPWEPQP